jgi:hypothetical protein
MSAFGARQTGARARQTRNNVVALNARQHRQPLSERLGRHAALFAEKRRVESDVFWLKENAEFLNILEATDCAFDAEQALVAYKNVYCDLDARLAAFPQYYRFILSIALDLEDLGMPGQHANRMCDWARRMDLPGAELSDLQRAEAQRLLARRGMARPDPALMMRLHRFMSRTETFALPNRKAAYELTHIAFYLSEYGRRDPGLSAEAIQSLTFAGLLAYLDQNIDLLSEICIALRYAGRQPSSLWEGAVMAAVKSANVTSLGDEQAMSLTQDSYHEYFVGTWLAALAGAPIMPAILPDGAARIDIPARDARPLRKMSRALSDMKTDDWAVAKRHLLTLMEEDEIRVLEAAETSTTQFGVFYQVFARVGRP